MRSTLITCALAMAVSSFAQAAPSMKAMRYPIRPGSMGMSSKFDPVANAERFKKTRGVSTTQPVRKKKLKVQIIKDSVVSYPDGGLGYQNQTICMKTVEINVYDDRISHDPNPLDPADYLDLVSCESTLGSEPVIIQFSGLEWWNRVSIFDGEAPQDLSSVSAWFNVTPKNFGSPLPPLPDAPNLVLGSRDLNAKSVLGGLYPDAWISCTSDGSNSSGPIPEPNEPAARKLRSVNCQAEYPEFFRAIFEVES